jgi:cupin fold WbuC family metalloprotein
MQIRSTQPDVFVTDEEIVEVNEALIARLRAEVPKSEKKRVRFCAHRDNRDRVHEMFIALGRDSYIAPHRHTGKTESFHVLDGEADIVIFDDAGAIRRVVRMGAPASGRTFFYRMSQPLFHTVLVQSDVVIFHETTNGPWVKGDWTLAPWAPAEDGDAARAYAEQLRAAIAKPGGAGP